MECVVASVGELDDSCSGRVALFDARSSAQSWEIFVEEINVVAGFNGVPDQTGVRTPYLASFNLHLPLLEFGGDSLPASVQ